MDAANISGKKNKANKTGAKKFLYIIFLSVFALIFIISSVLFYFATYQAAHTMLIIALIAAIIMTLIMTFAVSNTYARFNGGGADYGKAKDMGYYFKRIWLTIILLVLISIAVSFAGGEIVNGFIGGLRSRMSNAFLRGLVLKGPMFIVYMAVVYKIFVKQGFMDAERKTFNFGFKIFSLIAVFMFMLPNMIFDSMYDTFVLEALTVNVHSVLSPNIDLYNSGEFGTFTFNGGSFSMFLVILTVIITIAIESAVMLFAYRRGKKIFISQHIRKLEENEYDTDEKF